MSQVIGFAFEELDENEMNNVSGGAVVTTVLTTWSSAPCLIGASIGSILYTIYH